MNGEFGQPDGNEISLTENEKKSFESHCFCQLRGAKRRQFGITREPVVRSF